MERLTCVSFITGILFSASLSLGSGGAYVIAPGNALSTSEWLASASGKTISLIDGSGLSGSGDVELQTHDNQADAFTMWHAGDTDGGLGGPTGYPPPVDAQALVFDLNGVFDLTGAYIWNHNQAGLTLRGVDELEVLVSSDTDPLTASFVSVGTFNLAEASGGVEPAQLISFAATAVRLVKFDINSAHSGATDEYVGLSEVRFLVEPIFTDGFESGYTDAWSETNP